MQTPGEPPRFKLILSLALLPDTRIRAIRLAAVVGTVLFLINQWEALLGEAPVQWAKAVLTYCVPYLVSTYTSVMKDYETTVHARAKAG